MASEDEGLPDLSGRDERNHRKRTGLLTGPNPVLLKSRILRVYFRIDDCWSVSAANYRFAR